MAMRENVSMLFLYIIWDQNGNMQPGLNLYPVFVFDIGTRDWSLFIASTIPDRQLINGILKVTCNRNIPTQTIHIVNNIYGTTFYFAFHPAIFF